MNKILKAIKTSIPFPDFKGRKRGEGTRALRLRIFFFFENAAARLAANRYFYAESIRKLETLRQKQPTAIQDNQIAFTPDEYTRLLLILADARVAEERTRWPACDQTRQELDKNGGMTLPKLLEPYFNDVSFEPDQRILEGKVLYEHLNANGNINRRDGNNLRAHYNKLRILYSKACAKEKASGQGDGKIESFCEEELKVHVLLVHLLVQNDPSFDFMNKAAPDFVDMVSGKSNAETLSFDEDSSSPALHQKSCSSRKKRKGTESPMSLRFESADEEKLLHLKQAKLCETRVTLETRKDQRAREKHQLAREKHQLKKQIAKQKHKMSTLKNAIDMFVAMGKPVPESLMEKMMNLVAAVNVL